MQRSAEISHPSMAKKIEIRPIQLSDIPRMNELFRSSGYDDGEHIYRLCCQTCDTSLWQVAVNEKGEIVGTYRGLLLRLKEATIIHGCRQVVREDYQGKGIAVRFRKAFGNHPVIANASLDAIAKLSWLKKFSMKLVGYSGKPTLENFASLFPAPGNLDFDIQGLETKEMEILLGYDRIIFDYDRRQFMQEWCKSSAPGDPYTRTIIAKRMTDSVVVGFGTIKEFDPTYKLIPVYADSPTVAKEILKALVNLYVTECGGKPLRVYFDARNRTMMEFVKALNFKHGFTTVRAYTRGADGKGRPEVIEQYVKSECVFAYQYFWPV